MVVDRRRSRSARPEPIDLAIETADTAKCRQDGLNLAGVQLATLWEDDHIVGRNLRPPEPVADLEQRAYRQGNAGQSPAERDLSDLNSATDLDLLARGQEGNLADLLEIKPDRILPPRSARGQNLLGKGWRDLFGILVGERLAIRPRRRQELPERSCRPRTLCRFL